MSFLYHICVSIPLPLKSCLPFLCNKIRCFWQIHVRELFNTVLGESPRQSISNSLPSSISVITSHLRATISPPRAVITTKVVSRLGYDTWPTSSSPCSTCTKKFFWKTVPNYWRLEGPFCLLCGPRKVGHPLAFPIPYETPHICHYDV